MSHHHASSRDDLTGEHPAGDVGQLILALLFMATWLADTLWLNVTTFTTAWAPNGLRLLLAAILLLFSGYLVWNGHAVIFGPERTPPRVIRDGVFGIVRHPIYLSELLFYLGLLALAPSFAAILIWLTAFAFLHTIARYEEHLLLQRFGEDYSRYRKAVPMWLPRPWRRKE